MKTFEWRKELDTGVELIDRQHRQYARFVNAFLKACSSGPAGRPDMNKAFAFLHAYVREHLGTEESLMEEFDYPQREQHMRSHAYLRRWTDDAQSRLAREGEEVSSEFLTKMNYVLVDWFQEHIQRTDKKLTAWLKTRARELGTPRLLRLVRGLFGRGEREKQDSD